jgi:hypothetical protein
MYIVFSAALLHLIVPEIPDFTSFHVPAQFHQLSKYLRRCVVLGCLHIAA